VQDRRCLPACGMKEVSVDRPTCQDLVFITDRSSVAYSRFTAIHRSEHRRKIFWHLYSVPFLIERPVDELSDLAIRVLHPHSAFLILH
jgi:hypothetical protein